MPPAHQGFDAGNLTAHQIDLRLIVQAQFLPIQGAAQVGFEGQAIPGLAAISGEKNRRTPRPCILAW